MVFISDVRPSAKDQVAEDAQHLIGQSYTPPQWRNKPKSRHNRAMPSKIAPFLKYWCQILTKSYKIKGHTLI